MKPLDYERHVSFDVGLNFRGFYFLESPQLGAQLIDVILLFEKGKPLLV